MTRLRRDFLLWSDVVEGNEDFWTAFTREMMKAVYTIPSIVILSSDLDLVKCGGKVSTNR